MALIYRSALERAAAQRGYYGMRSCKLEAIRRLAEQEDIHVALDDSGHWELYSSAEVILELIRELGGGRVEHWPNGEGGVPAPWSVEFTDWWAD